MQRSSIKSEATSLVELLHKKTIVYLLLLNTDKQVKTSICDHVYQSVFFKLPFPTLWKIFGYAYNKGFMQAVKKQA